MKDNFLSKKKSLQANTVNNPRNLKKTINRFRPPRQFNVNKPSIKFKFELEYFAKKNVHNELKTKLKWVKKLKRQSKLLLGLSK